MRCASSCVSQSVSREWVLLVQPGTRWTTRGLLPRVVVVHAVDHELGFARVVDESTREFWLEPIERIVREWTRRTSRPKLQLELGGAL